MDESAEHPPAKTEPAKSPPNYDRRIRVWGSLIIVSLLGIVVPPLYGLTMTVLSMIRAFTMLESTGGASPEALANDISTALFTTVGALVVSAIFFVLFLVCFVYWLINLSARKNDGSH